MPTPQYMQKKTYSPKVVDVQHNWLLIDVKGKTLGKVATTIAALLRGKHKPTFSPHIDCGDFIIVINAKEIHLSGMKKEQKTYNYHTRYPNGLKTTTAGKLLNEKPEKVLWNAVAGMIPHNKLKKDILQKLKIYSGGEHKHKAQEPKVFDI